MNYRRYVPVLKDMPIRYLFEPWKAPMAVQERANCIVGKDYPLPIVEHKTASAANHEQMEKVINRLRDSGEWQDRPSPTPPHCPFPPLRRPSFTVSRLSWRNFFLVQPLLKKIYQGIEWFSQLAGLQSLTILSMLIWGITITLTGDWHSRQLATLSPSIMLHNSLLTEGKIWHISVLWMWACEDSPKLCFSS